MEPLSYFPVNKIKIDRTNVSGPGCSKVDNTIHWINCYPVDSALHFVHSYPLDSDLFIG